MKRFLYTFLFLLFQIPLFAQQEVYVGGEFIGGVLTSSSLNTDLLKQRNYSPTLGGQINVHLRFYDLFALEAGIGQHYSRVRLIDNDFEQQAEDFSIDIKSSSYHWNYYFAASTYYRIKKTDSYLYGKMGFSFNTYGESNVSEQANFTITDQNIDRTIDYTSSFKESNFSLIPEIGLQHKFYKGNLLSIGLRYNIGQSTAFEGDYTVTDNVSGESRTDGLSSKGNSITFTLRYDFRLFHLNQKEKTKKVKLDEIAIDVSEKKEKKQETTTVGPINREEVVSDRIKVNTKKVKIEIWDHQTVDGDRITLVFNNQILLENYTLKKEKYFIEVELEEGVNTFIMHALNLGDIKPNTAALTVDDGEKKKRLILQSNMSKSASLQIKYKK